jgi:hypothetical protein
MTGDGMRRSLALALPLFLAACASRPQPPVAETPTPPPSNQPRRLLGLTANELVSQLGTPRLQVREGVSLKIQFQNQRCTLDAYLYPQTSGGQLRVSHIDTRGPSGVDTDQAACISSLERRS